MCPLQGRKPGLDDMETLMLHMHQDLLHNASIVTEVAGEILIFSIILYRLLTDSVSRFGFKVYSLSLWLIKAYRKAAGSQGIKKSGEIPQ